LRREGIGEFRNFTDYIRPIFEKLGDSRENFAFNSNESLCSFTGARQINRTTGKEVQQPRIPHRKRVRGFFILISTSRHH